MSNKGSSFSVCDVGSSRRRRDASVFQKGVGHHASSKQTQSVGDKVTDFAVQYRLAAARRIAGALAVATILTACARAQTAATSTPPVSPAESQLRQQSTSAGAQSGSTGAPATFGQRSPDPRDVLYPGDIVRLKIWREPDLSGDYDVNVHGEAVFPKIGSIHVTDMTIDSLQRLLVSTYSEYLKNPAIEITPLRRVTVLGAVKNPGLYPVDPTMSVSDAIALAGGATPDGNQKHLELIRNGKKQNVSVTTTETIATTEIRSGDELFIPERSWLSRNGYIVGAVIGAVAIFGTTMISINHGF